MSRGTPFTLTKWYMDCVAADGRAAIGYWASLAWRDVTLTWQSITIHTPGGPSVTRSRLSSSLPPHVSDRRISWNAPALGCVADFDAQQPAIEARLLERDDGVVQWRAEAPVAAASFALSGLAPVVGGGYAECIFLSVPVWRLPIRELRWGRWLDNAAKRSVVWIDWRGESPRSWVFVDGVTVPAAIVTDDTVEASGMQLTLSARRTLQARRFAEVAATIAPLRALIPASMLALRETKWCSAGLLREASAAPRTGFAIHELAVFR